MKVSLGVIQTYLSQLTEGIAASSEEPMGDLSAYDSEIDLMVRAARAAGDEALLRRSIDSLLSAPRGRIDAFAGQVHGFRDDELVELLTHTWERVWPEVQRSLPGEAPPMEFVPMSDVEWAARQGKA